MMSADDNEIAGLSSLWESGQHLRAGADYLAALQKLGLDPDCLFWADDEVVGHPVLVLVTRQFDRAGPLSLSRLLFKAYDAAATPREINPFVLRLHSPEQAIIRELTKIVSLNPRIEFRPDDPSLPVQPWNDVFEISSGGLKFRSAWVYKWMTAPKKLSAVTMLKQWRRFAENVDRLAA